MVGQFRHLKYLCNPKDLQVNHLTTFIMRKFIQVSLALVAVFAITASKASAQDIEKEISTFAAEWQTAFNAGNSEALSQMYTRDVLVLNADGSTANLTNEQIAAQFEQDFKNAKSSMEISLDRMMAAPGGKVKVSGHFNIVDTDLKSGKSTESTGSFEHVVIKFRSGWKLCELKLIQN